MISPDRPPTRFGQGAVAVTLPRASVRRSSKWTWWSARSRRFRWPGSSGPSTAPGPSRRRRSRRRRGVPTRGSDRGSGRGSSAIRHPCPERHHCRPEPVSSNRAMGWKNSVWKEPNISRTDRVWGTNRRSRRRARSEEPVWGGRWSPREPEGRTTSAEQPSITTISAPAVIGRPPSQLAARKAVRGRKTGPAGPPNHREDPDRPAPLVRLEVEGHDGRLVQGHRSPGQIRSQEAATICHPEPASPSVTSPRPPSSDPGP